MRQIQDPTEAPETCEQCQFDGDRWTDQDATHTIAHAADLVGFALEALDRVVANERPGAATWSIAEYVDHLREVTSASHVVAAVAADDPGADLGGPEVTPFGPEAAGIDLDVALARLDDEGRSFAKRLLRLETAQWRHTVRLDDTDRTVGWLARHLCHDLMHHLTDIADIRAALEAPFAPMRGTVAQLNASDGGVPKRSVASATIDTGGLQGDRQATRRHHGRPWQALCVYSAEVIDALAAEGHPIERGSTGENITLAGIDWSRLRGGLVVEIGDIRCRLSAPAAPCSKNSRFFLGGDHMRMAHDNHPGWSRWYASVLTAGNVSPGDQVTVSASVAVDR